MSMHVDMTVVPFLVVAARKPENFIEISHHYSRKLLLVYMGSTASRRPADSQATSATNVESVICNVQ